MAEREGTRKGATRHGTPGGPEPPLGEGGSRGRLAPRHGDWGPRSREGASPSARGHPGHEALSRAFYEIGISSYFIFPISYYFRYKEDVVVMRRCYSGRFGRDGDLFQGSRTRGIVTDSARSWQPPALAFQKSEPARSAEPGLYRDAPSLPWAARDAPYLAESGPY